MRKRFFSAEVLGRQPRVGRSIWSRIVVGLVLAGCGVAADRGVVANTRSPYAQLKALDLEEVRWTSGFWAERVQLVRKNTLPVLWEALHHPDNGARFDSFLEVTGQGRRITEPKKLNWWSDGDVYKTLEAMAFIYALTKDPALDRRMDEMISVFAQAQEPDGYLSTPIKIRGAQRWQNLNHHELYNMGHLMTAACIHHRATGKRTFLDIAVRVGDYLYKTFQPRPPELAHFGFNPSNIMGAVELYRTTGDKKYLDLAGVFASMRGSRPGGSDLNQTRVPLRKETEAVGHAVTANYLYAGAADVYAETGEKALLEALTRIWTDVTTRKMYVTGAVGNLYSGTSKRHDQVHEAYGVEYELPNRLAYTETCANIALAMWNWRLLSLTGEAKYADVVERVLYNSMLSGMGVEGKDFYYNNPLRRYGDELPRVVRPQDSPLRAPHLVCYCCPTNVARTIASLNGWAYTKSGSALWVHLYGGNRLETNLGGGKLILEQNTEYPWDGVVRFNIQEAPSAELALMLRIPAWAQGAAVQVGGEAPQKATAGAYHALRRRWRSGDRIELRLPMAPRLVQANPYVESARNQVAVMRGPLVYALESPDLPAGVRVSEIALPAGIRLTPRFDRELLGGVTVLEGEARRIPEGDWTATLYRTLRTPQLQAMRVRLIPYYAWANRGMSHMTVWIPVVW